MSPVEPEPITRSAPDLAGRVVAAQRWSDLTFLHWRVESDRVAPLLPPGVRPDEFDGSSWVGLIPFLLDRASVLGGPPVPYVGRFAEINVRLYGVDERGRRGVVFRSLEASRLLAVLAARVGFGLPYRWARTGIRREGLDGRAVAPNSPGVPGETMTASSRRHGGGPAFRMRATVGEPIAPTALDDFLTARWALFARHLGRTLRLPNEHAPWALHTARLDELDDELLAAGGLAGLATREPDSVLWSPGVSTRFLAS
ncbi:MAG: DUF2071 domain-containing protein [Actinomycetales bacterium]|nr:DUF2071 domain-containing protein [Actinomycetales bacterium]